MGGQNWLQHHDYAFVASPQGNGLDCHRTWEALILESIPIVRTSSLDPLFAEFPVAIVKDWSEVTDEKLRSWHTELSPMFTDELRQKLTVEFWLKKIQFQQQQQALRKPLLSNSQNRP